MRNLIVFGVLLLLAITILQTDGVGTKSGSRSKSLPDLKSPITGLQTDGVGQKSRSRSKSLPDLRFPFKFGDILAFRRTLYTHYGIWVGDKTIVVDGKHDRKGGENIFHFTGPIKDIRLSGCLFDTLSPNELPKVDNYLDREEFSNLKQTDAQIVQNIQEKIGQCGYWLPRSNNCEHLATYVRYKVKFAWQQGRNAGKLCKNYGDYTKLILNILQEKVKNVGIQCNIADPCIMAG